MHKQFYSFCWNGNSVLCATRFTKNFLYLRNITKMTLEKSIASLLFSRMYIHTIHCYLYPTLSKIHSQIHTFFKHTYIHTYIHANTHTYIHRYMQTYIHTYTLYMHTYILNMQTYISKCSFMPTHLHVVMHIHTNMMNILQTTALHCLVSRETQQYLLSNLSVNKSKILDCSKNSIY